MNYISKQVFLEALDCPAAGWARRRGLLDDEVDDFHARQGEEIGRLARSVFPDGRLVEAESLQRAAQETAKLIETADVGTLFDVRTLYEPTFLVEPYATKADVLQLGSTGWRLYEVKMSKADHADYVDDLAYTAMVITAWGLALEAASLVILDEDYRRGMSYDRLFRTIDHTDEVLERAAEFRGQWDRVDELTAADDPPETDLQLACKKCPYFRQFLWPDEGHHVFELPRLSPKRFRPLKQRGIERIEDVPPEIELTPQQERVRHCVRTGEPYVGPGLGEALDEIEWPAFYLDFETISTAVPIYPDSAPFDIVPFQYSIHVGSAPGRVDDHREFLADPGADPRRELAAALLRDLESTGSVLIYTGYERSVVRTLAEQVPDLDTQLLALVDRMVDLHKVIVDHVAHPDFHGSTSIKKTLPVLAPEMSYEHLDIGEGGDAMARYAELVWGDRDAEEAERILDNLRKYCKQDTLAMVRLHERLVEFAS